MKRDTVTKTRIITQEEVINVIKANYTASRPLVKVAVKVLPNGDYEVTEVDTVFFDV